MVAHISQAEHDHLRSRATRDVAILLWIVAKDIHDGSIVRTGLWTGKDHREFRVEGQSRGYFGAGGLVSVGPIRSVIGTDVQETTASFALTAPEVELAVRRYELRQADVEIHRALFDAFSGELIGITRKFKGWIDRLEITGVTDTAPGRCEVVMAGAARCGTRGLSLKRSDASYQLRKLPDGRPDLFGQYGDISGSVPVKWGGA
ncbi:MAG: hypothetical protein Q4G22_09915 [Paracoccus sp. (in: a-proteobacteria)]|uniref:hypothetical protein n=1 Tax=Paracoccus sp. TaxID=267 RepID=UPI0026E02F38|nr:hypothetical protein [Paracoccus sp. (in: a-proteobacteria)]MDO5632141.1 hypothetical protein [Paracoccus sp. (in: a-proteobacteria)]